MDFESFVSKMNRIMAWYRVWKTISVI